MIALVHAMPKKKHSRGIQSDTGYTGEIQSDTEYAGEIQPASVNAPQSEPLNAEYPADGQSLGDYATLPLEYKQTASEEYDDASAPDEVNTIIKHIAVPYERQIPIDNPILTPVENNIPIDNPVPVVKFIDKPVPIHVEHPVLVPVVKTEHVPQPYVHKVHVILQKVFVEKPTAHLKPYIIGRYHAKLPF